MSMHKSIKRASQFGFYYLHIRFWNPLMLVALLERKADVVLCHFNISSFDFSLNI